MQDRPAAFAAGQASRILDGVRRAVPPRAEPESDRKSLESLPAESCQRPVRFGDRDAHAEQHFTDNLRTVLDEQHKQTLEAQEAFANNINGPIQALTASIRELLQPLRGPRSPSSTPPPAIDVDLQATDELLQPFRRTRSPTRTPIPATRRPPPAARIIPPATNTSQNLPIREMTAFTTTTGVSETSSTDPRFRISGVKPAKFYGKDGENVLSWLHKIEQLFLLHSIPEDMKVANISFLFSGDADSFFHYLVVKNNGMDPTWQELRHALISKYENPLARADILRDKLHAVRYHGTQRMAEYCEKFRSIEIQIYDMAFADRILAFIKYLPPEAARFIKNGNHQSKDMEVAYQLARQWAINAKASGGTNLGHHSQPRQGKPLLKFGRKSKPTPTTSTSTTKDESSSSDEGLDYIVQKLYAMDLAQVTCFKCQKKGHFARDCKGTRTKRAKFDSKSKKTFYNTVHYESDDGVYSDPAQEGTYDPSEQESSYSSSDDDDDEAINMLVSHSFTAPAPPKRDPSTNAQSRSKDVKTAINLMSSYEVIKNETVVVKSPGSVKLPIYDAVLDGKEHTKTVIDGGATTQYISEKMAKQLGAKITRVKPRTVVIADKEIVMINGVTTFEMKLGDLPKETISAYTFPLASVDLILGLPWLQKHNPHTDYRTLSYEFTRNGRRYFLYPRKPTPKIRIVSAEEFKSFADYSANLYLISWKDLRKAKTSEDGKEQMHEEPPKSQPESQSETAKSKPPEPPKIPRKILRFIKRKCPDLLRDMGRPSNLEPFDIDTGDAEPIKISPRPYSPVDLDKIKEFIDENLKTGVISESDSPWSFPLVLAAKPNGGTRICVDYRALNRISKKDAHPLPRIDESFLKFFGMRYFTNIDLRSGYWQILLNLPSDPKRHFLLATDITSGM